MKAVFFDFDGTLSYTSLNFWKKMWLTLGYDIKEGSYYKQLFNDAYAGKLTHQQWCDKICEKYIEAGMSRDMLLDIANTIDLMDGFEEMVTELKKRGFLLFIVSGNVKEVIHHNLKKHIKLFDGIYANSFQFNEKGKLVKIVGTPYDNEGKADLIKLMSSQMNIPMKNIWFVGNGSNDEWVYQTGCKTLLINPEGTKKHDDTNVWHQTLRNVTNLTKILDVIND